MAVHSTQYTIKSALWIILLISTAIEIMRFPSVANITGCVVSIASTWIFFATVLKINVIRRRPIGFIAFLYPFLFMYLPLPATLLDGNEISYGMTNPVQSFILQFIFFCCIVLAFLIADRLSNTHKGVYNFLKSYGYYTPPTNTQLWVLGGIGFAIKFFLMSNQFGDESIKGAGTIGMFAFLVYSPICILFRDLMDGTQCSAKMRKYVWAYMCLLSVLFISTNSRSQMISPFIMWFCGFLLSKIYDKGNTTLFSTKKILIGIFGLWLVTGPVTDMGYAMLLVRGERYGISFSELLGKSIDTFMDKDKMRAARELDEKLKEEEEGENNSGDWNEEYVSNLFLNRLCNYRVVDATIYHAENVGYANSKMIEEFVTRMQIAFPQPVVDALFGNIDKSDYNKYSACDYLYHLSTGMGLGGFKVGGDVGLGLATFGLLFFPIAIVIYTLTFMLLNSVAVFDGKRAFFPFFTIVLIYFKYMLKLQVANGIIAQVTNLIYGFWFSAISYIIVYKIVRSINPPPPSGSYSEGY